MEDQENFLFLQDMCNIARVLPNLSIFNIYEELIKVKNNEKRVSIILSDYFSTYDPEKHSCMLDDMLKIKQVLPNYPSININDDLSAVKHQTNRVQLVLKNYFDSIVKTTKRRLPLDSEKSDENNFDKKIKLNPKTETVTNIDNIALNSQNQIENYSDKTELISESSQINYKGDMKIQSEIDFDNEDLLRIFFNPSEESAHSNLVIQQPKIKKECISDEFSVSQLQKINRNEKEVKNEEINGNEIEVKNEFDECSTTLFTRLCNLHPNFSPNIISDVCEDLEINLYEIANDDTINLVTSVLMNLEKNEKAYESIQAEKFSINNKLSSFETQQSSKSDSTEILENLQHSNEIDQQKDINECKIKIEQFDSTVIPENNIQLENIKIENICSYSPNDENNAEDFEKNSSRERISLRLLTENTENIETNEQSTNINDFSQLLNSVFDLPYICLPDVESNYKIMEPSTSKTNNISAITISKINNPKCVATKKEISINQINNNNNEKPSATSVNKHKSKMSLGSKQILSKVSKTLQSKSAPTTTKQKCSTSINPKLNNVQYVRKTPTVADLRVHTAISKMKTTTNTSSLSTCTVTNTTNARPSSLMKNQNFVRYLSSTQASVRDLKTLQNAVVKTKPAAASTNSINIRKKVIQDSKFQATTSIIPSIPTKLDQNTSSNLLKTTKNSSQIGVITKLDLNAYDLNQLSPNSNKNDTLILRPAVQNLELEPINFTGFNLNPSTSTQKNFNSVINEFDKVDSIENKNDKTSTTSTTNFNIIQDSKFKPTTNMFLSTISHTLPSTSSTLNINITTNNNNFTQNYTTPSNLNTSASNNLNSNLQQMSVSSTNSHQIPSTSTQFNSTCTLNSLTDNISTKIRNDKTDINVENTILRVRKDIFDFGFNDEDDDVILLSIDRLPDKQPVDFTVKPNLIDLPKQEIILTNSVNNSEQIASTSNDNNKTSTSCPGKTHSFYFKLLEMFPDICPDFLRNLCGSVEDSEENLNDLISKLLTGNYEKRIRYASPINQLDFEDQYKILLDLFPDADPTYLQHHCERLIDQPTEFSQFVTNLVETKNYPSKESYLKKLKLSAQEKQYTTEFDVKKFLEVVPDPEQYFNDPKRKITNRESLDTDYALTFLKNHYRNITVRDIFTVYKECQFSVIQASKTLEQFKRFLKTKRKIYPLTSCQNIPLLQEIAYVKHKKEILEYIENQKLEKQQARINAKQAGLLKTCQCCYDDEVMTDDTATCESGQHIFCKQCIRKGCEIVIGDGKLDFPCLESCNSFFTLQVLQAVLTPKVFSKMAQRKQLEEVKSAGIEDLEFCPFCDFATIPAPGDKLFRCLNNDCMKESCRLCKEPSHIPLHCDEVEKDKDVKMRTYIEDKMTEALLRKCYKCGLKFIKESGCNKMTCSCGAMMCYVCNKPVQDYKHFNGQGGDKYHLCPLYSDTHKMHMDAVKQSAESAKQELGLYRDNNQLKHDPTRDLEQHYSRLAAQNPAIPNIPNIPVVWQFQMPPP